MRNRFLPTAIAWEGAKQPPLLHPLQHVQVSLLDASNEFWVTCARAKTKISTADPDNVTAADCNMLGEFKSAVGILLPIQSGKAGVSEFTSCRVGRSFAWFLLGGDETGTHAESKRPCEQRHKRTVRYI